MKLTLAVALLLFTTVYVVAQIAGSGSMGPRFDRRDYMGMGLGGSPTSNAPSPPVGCDGTIDFSQGCVQPIMVGGI